MKKAGSRIFNPMGAINGRLKSYREKLEQAKLHRPPDRILIEKYTKEIERLEKQHQRRLKIDSFGNWYYE